MKDAFVFFAVAVFAVLMFAASPEGSIHRY